MERWLRAVHKVCQTILTIFDFSPVKPILPRRCLKDEVVVVVVVVVVYLTTNQRHLGYLSSGNGHLAGRYSTYPLGSREPTPLGVQGRPVTISQNKPKAIIKHCAPDAFLFSDPI